MCHECKHMPLSEKRASLFNAIEDNEISCCFYQFRKLRSIKLGGNFSVAGFLDPQRDPLESQISIWKDSVSKPAFQDVYKAKFILNLIGMQFYVKLIFGDFANSKTAIFIIFEALNLDFSEFLQFFKIEEILYLKIQIEGPSTSSKWHLLRT